MPVANTSIERAYVEARIERITESGCWVWIGHVSMYGYGIAYISKKNLRAHRLVYEMHKGPIPADRPFLDHLCRVRCCVNPAHLEAVTPWENNARGLSVSAANIIKTHCIHGHELPAAPNRKYGQRGCLECERQRARRAHAKRQEALWTQEAGDGQRVARIQVIHSELGESTLFTKGRVTDAEFLASVSRYLGQAITGFAPIQRSWWRTTPDATGEFERRYHQAEPGSRGAFMVTYIEERSIAALSQPSKGDSHDQAK